MSSDLINLLIPPADRLVESLGGPGVYYLIPVPDGVSTGKVRWELVAFSFDEYGDDSGHSELWLECVVAPLAASWTRTLRCKAAQLESALSDLDHAFPRGRITRELEHLHGNDAAAVGWSLDRIERRFGLDGKCRRKFDSHETCNQSQRDVARKLLGLELKPSWPASASSSPT